MARLDIEHWTHEREVELHDIRYKNYQPEYHTGIMVRLFGGWEWTAENGNLYRTNGEGEGLWRWSDQRAEWQQTRGTCQFCLPENRRRAIQKLRRSNMAPRKI